MTAFTAYMVDQEEEEEEEEVPSQTHTLWENEFSPVALMLLHRLKQT